MQFRNLFENTLDEKFEKENIESLLKSQSLNLTKIYEDFKMSNPQSELKRTVMIKLRGRVEQVNAQLDEVIRLMKTL